MSLENTDVNDSAVPVLSTLSSLRRLALWRTRFTTRGLAALRAALPACEIFMRDPGRRVAKERRQAAMMRILINGGPEFRHSEAFSFQIATDNQEETDRYWNAIVGNGGQESQSGWWKDRCGISWQVRPGVLMDALSGGGDDGNHAFGAVAEVHKIAVALTTARH